MMRLDCVLPGFFLLSCSLSAWAECTECAEDLQLDRGGLECTKLKIDDWINSSKDQGVVKVALSECASPAQGEPGDLAPVPTRGEQTKTESTSDQVWILTTEQLLCLKDYLPDLRVNQQNYAYFHFSACQA